MGHLDTGPHTYGEHHVSMKAEMGMMFYMPWDVSDGQQPQKLGEGHQIDSFSQLLEVPNLAPH